MKIVVEKGEHKMSEPTLEDMEAVELLKEEVIGKLRQVEVQVLTEICVEASVTIPPKKFNDELLDI